MNAMKYKDMGCGHVCKNLENCTNNKVVQLPKTSDMVRNSINIFNEFQNSIF